MTTFSTSAPTNHSTGTILQAALATLMHNGFRINTRDGRTATLTGPGLHSTRQNPLLGASTIRLVLTDHELRLDSELGGVDSMRRFLMRFPFLLGLGLGLLLGVVGGLTMGNQFGVGFGVPWARGWKWMLLAMGSAMLPVTPWLFLSPFLSNILLKRTQYALTSLVTNAVKLSQPA